MSSPVWRRPASTALACTLMIGGLVSGVTAPAALAQPNGSATENQEQPKRVSPDQILMTISQEYQTGSGGGQVSKLIEQVINLRKRGVKPSMANAQALSAALDKRPNQKPLIAALEGTLATQRQQFARAGTQTSGGAPSVATPGSPIAPMSPTWGPGNPMDRSNDSPVFEIPGR
ncbi:hypothetical protein NGTWS0302_05480 [Mycolicibacterium cyprinidarum]|uniref:Uncharacterized protein n=1 Tax=Mycolicibacterium cyprinidarum TaxID=2860311 RepID=A0ABQ4V9B3_9MYCO|nr:hypothetical protein NGTWS0302_05480 [Mycolicibacterium sp. NGTWS0302]GJF14837.1 hypothetical protein NGTWS1702_17320 [Mycolicibacterium sp. NGTWSNA01]GJF17707.1 hypothetical protein NGTWS1803_05770 [Mycolicibacterium sp. NGTWS1803]